VRQLTIDNMQIGAANAASCDLDTDFARTWLPIWKLGPFERRAQFVQNHSLHDALGKNRSC
jgi:hypothetical protein